ncbi:MAG TPA: 4-hydroxy-3-methylbut-2-enyl diphosphate reductase, partial [Dehalococcoidia bacterium]|nr:4-hydroxy-3-methylbut-2-enyl diphosphate reductase [Dehalococcoidia bacterium]
REVKGVLGWAGDKGIAIQDGEQLPKHLPSRIAVISQTTQSPEKFAGFVSKIMTERVADISEFRLINTLCNVTSGQQAAARELSAEVDLMLVVGGKSSANTRHLLEVCRENGTPSHHVETAAELESEWFRGVNRVGVTAGASTPDSAVEAVVQRVREIAAELESATARPA